MAETRKGPKSLREYTQQRLDSKEVVITNRWYLERVRVKRMLHELGRCMEEAKKR